jgi:hypothetical protein
VRANGWIQFQNELITGGDAGYRMEASPERSM